MLKFIFQHKDTEILILLFIGVLMGALDISIVGPAIPSIEKTIHVEPRALGWIFSIYVLLQLTGIPLFAKLSDIFGRRNIYALSVGIFGLGSLVVVFSHYYSILLLGRAIQGFGASGIFPIALAVIGDVFPPEKRGSALGMIGAVFGIAFIVGPILAGTLLAFFPWNSLFLINVPIAVGLIIASLKLLPSEKIISDKKLDITGVILLGALLTCFAIGLNNIEPNNFTASLSSLRVYPYLTGSVILFISFILLEKKTKHPIVKIEMFYALQIRLVGIIAIGTGIFQSSVIFIPNFAVNMFNINSSKASFMLLPVVLASAVGSPVSGRFLDKIGSRIVVLSGLVISAAAIFSMSLVNSNIIHFYFSGAFLGIGISMLMGPPLRYIMLNEVPPQDRALTQGMLALFISVGQITGSALISVIIASGNTNISGYKSAFLSLSFLMLFLLSFAYFLKNRQKELETIRKK
ncbi:MAG: MFS transporter [FCB group bacterium]|jgi:EmrB/QacA subfamily drug resistance transporter